MTGADEPAPAAAPLAPTVDDAVKAEAARAARVGQLVDQYRLVGLLGHGAMGTVYRVRHELLGREYALKVLASAAGGSDTRTQRFLREARAAAQLDHPNVVKVVYSGVSAEGDAFLVMELLEGQSLASVIAEGPLDAERAAAIARQLALGLEAIHGMGFLHRDLKPSNVIVAPDGTVKILDLGLVGSIARDRSEARLTQQGHVMGTPLYMAPETFTADEFTPQSDLYALGVVVHEMLAGRPPFEGNMHEILWHQCYSPPPALPASRGLDAVAARLMAKDPAERLADARAVVEELDRRLSRGAVAELVEDAPARIARSVSRALAASPPAPAARRGPRPWMVVVVGTAVATAATALVVAAASTRAPVAEVIAVPDPVAGGGGAARGDGAEASPHSARADAPRGAGEAVAEARARGAHAPSDSTASGAGPRADTTEAAAADAPRPDSGATGAAAATGAAPRADTTEAAATDAPRPDSAAASGAPRAARAAPATARARRVSLAPREVLLTSEPPGARVETAQGVLGVTPVSVLLPGDRATTLTFRLAGHDDRRVRVPVGARAPTVHVRWEGR